VSLGSLKCIVLDYHGPRRARVSLFDGLKKWADLDLVVSVCDAAFFGLYQFQQSAIIWMCLCRGVAAAVPRNPALIGTGDLLVYNCRPLCIVISTYGDTRSDFFLWMEDWCTADRYPHEASSIDVLTSDEQDDRVMTGGLHSVASASCHSLVDRSGAWVPARVIPV